MLFFLPEDIQNTNMGMMGLKQNLPKIWAFAVWYLVSSKDDIGHGGTG